MAGGRIKGEPAAGWVLAAAGPSHPAAGSAVAPLRSAACTAGVPSRGQASRDAQVLLGTASGPLPGSPPGPSQGPSPVPAHCPCRAGLCARGPELGALRRPHGRPAQPRARPRRGERQPVHAVPRCAPALRAPALRRGTAGLLGLLRLPCACTRLRLRCSFLANMLSQPCVRPLGVVLAASAGARS